MSRPSPAILRLPLLPRARHRRHPERSSAARDGAPCFLEPHRAQSASVRDRSFKGDVIVVVVVVATAWHSTARPTTDNSGTWAGGPARVGAGVPDHQPVRRSSAAGRRGHQLDHQAGDQRVHRRPLQLLHQQQPDGVRLLRRPGSALQAAKDQEPSSKKAAASSAGRSSVTGRTSFFSLERQLVAPPDEGVRDPSGAELHARGELDGLEHPDPVRPSDRRQQHLGVPLAARARAAVRSARRPSGDATRRRRDRQRPVSQELDGREAEDAAPPRSRRGSCCCRCAPASRARCRSVCGTGSGTTRAHLRRILSGPGTVARPVFPYGVSRRRGH